MYNLKLCRSATGDFWSKQRLIVSAFQKLCWKSTFFAFLTTTLILQTHSNRTCLDSQRSKASVLSYFVQFSRTLSQTQKYVSMKLHIVLVSIYRDLEGVFWDISSEYLRTLLPAQESPLSVPHNRIYMDCRSVRDLSYIVEIQEPCQGIKEISKCDASSDIKCD